MQYTTQDCRGRPVAVGDEVKILDINPDPDLDEDQLDMFMAMIGATCAVERIDADGTGWVAVWWNGDEGTQLTLVGLTPMQMDKTDGGSD